MCYSVLTFGYVISFSDNITLVVIEGHSNRHMQFSFTSEFVAFHQSFTYHCMRFLFSDCNWWVSEVSETLLGPTNGNQIYA